MYAEKTECKGGKAVWGDIKLGRIPGFLYEDASLDTSRLARCAEEEALAEAASYSGLFEHALQFFQERCQHHIHKLVNGKRTIPNACRSKSRANECKHEAPWTNQVSPDWMQEPLVICRALAKKFHLRRSGMRNWLGQILTLRNEEWLNGCMPGLCLAFAGSNTDVKLNDRLPILRSTHEKHCKRNCVKKHSLKRATRSVQRTQNMIHGYFGGYIGKRQPAGAMETRKCVNKLFTLRAKIAAKSKAAQLRAASGRLVTDLEMNSTFRGAVEVFNLCRNLREGDVLFAECIRTFSSMTLDGRAWMQRLEVYHMPSKYNASSLQEFVPPTRKPNVKSAHARPSEIDVYGYRPLQHPWLYLSVYEFHRSWLAEPLLVPSYYENKGMQARTEWTEEGLQLIKSKAYRNNEIVAKPGLHYEVLPPSDDSYVLFPESPANIYKNFRHAWVLVRKTRPNVVMIEGLKLPSARQTTSYNAKYCSLFFKPWTLLHGFADVPHLSLLGFTTHALSIVYKSTDASRDVQKAGPAKSIAGSAAITDNIRWHEAWNAYVRGNVISKSAAKLIQSFLLKTLTGADTGGREADSEEEASENEDSLPALKLTSSNLKNLLTPAPAPDDDSNDDKKGLGVRLRATSRKKALQKQYVTSMRLCEKIWSSQTSTLPGGNRTLPGHMYANSIEEHKAARRAMRRDQAKRVEPFDRERNAAAVWVSSKTGHTLDEVLRNIQNQDEHPTAEQMAFLVHFVQRLKLELREQQTNTINQSASEPLLDLNHGFPGTGKSRVIGWQRQLMEQGLGWTHGVQFVCLAFQNSMAAQINGFTLHHWSGIPARNTSGEGTGDAHQQSIKCQALRVILIDEISMISAELLGTLEYAQACCYAWVDGN